MDELAMRQAEVLGKVVGTPASPGRVRIRTADAPRDGVVAIAR